MFTPRSGNLRGAILAGLCALVAGCQSSPTVASLFHWNGTGTAVAKDKAPDQQQVLLHTGSEVQWQVQTAQDQPGQVKSGSGVVSPAGTVEVGPYGTCKVAGLNLQQATTALEKHLAAYMTTPTVQLSTTVSDNQMDVAARPRSTFGQHAFARPAPTPMPTPTGSGETIVEVSGGTDIQSVTWRSSDSGRK